MNKVPIAPDGSFGKPRTITVTGPAAATGDLGLNGIDATRAITSLQATGHGVSALLFDPLTFTIGSGDEDSRKADGQAFRINLVTPDNGEQHVIELSHATLTNIAGYRAADADLTITINRGDGTLGRLNRSPEPYNKLISILNRADRATERMILEGGFASGERINENALAARFGVSRGPVREALRILERDGLVTILPRRGAIVTNPGTPAWKRPIAALSRARHKRKMEKRPPAPFIE